MGRWDGRRFAQAFAEEFGCKEIGPEFSFVFGGAKCCVRGIGVTLGVVAGFGLFERGEELRRIRVTEKCEAGDDVETVFGTEM